MKEIFVFGAGASFDSAGIPLGQDLAWRYYYNCSDMHEIGDNGPILDKETAEFKNFRHFLELSEITYPELKGIADTWEKDRRESIMNTPFPSWPSYGSKKYCVDHFAEVLIRQSDFVGVELLRQIVLEHITGAGNGSMENLLYLKFMTYQLKRIGPDFSIICFNFDTQLMLENNRNGFPFDYIIQFDKKTPFSSLTENKIPVFKLHGSLDWAFCPVCKKIEWLQPWVSKHMYENISCKMSSNCSGSLKPFIFLPHESMSDDLMAFLRNETAKKLREADKITIIGYSFPYYDTKELDLFIKNIKSSILLEVVDILPEEEILNKYKRMFPGINNIKVFSNGFSGYMQHNLS